MNSRWVSDVRAAALVDSSTETTYLLLLERARYTQGGPREWGWYPQWFGPLVDWIKTVMELAAQCELGNIKGSRDRRILSTAHLRSWRLALAKPMQLKPCVLTGRFGTGARDIPISLRALVTDDVAESGVGTATGTRLVVDLSRPGAPTHLSRLLARHRRIGFVPLCLWHGDTSYVEPPSAAGCLGVPLAPVTAGNLDRIRIWRLPSSHAQAPGMDYLWDFGGAAGLALGDASSLMYRFMTTCVAEGEADLPGCAESLIAGARERLHAAPTLDPNVRLEVFAPSSALGGTRACDAFTELRRRTGQQGDCRSVAGTLSTFDRYGARETLARTAAGTLRFHREDAPRGT